MTINILFETKYKILQTNYLYMRFTHFNVSRFGIIIFLLMSLLFNSCGALVDTSSDGNGIGFFDDEMPSEPGKCYAKCLMQDQYDTYERELLVYSGDEFNQEGIKLERIKVKPATIKWKKYVNEDSNSNDSDDSLIWCIVEVPEVEEDRYIVVDTVLIKEYNREFIYYEQLTSKGGNTEWKEVVCQKDMTSDLYFNIQIALIQKGYGENIVANGKRSRETKEAVVKYQKANGLPVGSFDIETMSMLGIEF